MTLVANLLNAIGGSPKLDEAECVPSYPTYLPHSAESFCVHLLPFSPRAVDTFLQIERPAAPHARPEPDRYHTIGQFYEALQDAFTKLSRRYDLFVKGRDEYQVTGRDWYYGGGGEPIRVHNLRSAIHALKEISEQGEGMPHSIFDDDRQFGQSDELAHYFRFEEIRLGRRFRSTDTPRSGPTGPELPVDWTAVYPMEMDPKAANYRNRPDVHRLMVDFNRGYTDLLLTLQHAFSGRPKLLREAVPQMYELKYKAQALMRIPTGRDDGTTVGPGFEFVGAAV
jgi:Ferritin-like